jgi:hypothetical protein
MKNPLLDLTQSFAQALANRNFQEAWQLLAPWLQAQISPEQLMQYAQRAVLRTCQQAGLPTTWPLSHVVSGLGGYSLRSLQRSASDTFGLTALHPSLSEKNYRGLMLVSLRPELMGALRPDAWTDFWLSIAEVNGTLCIGHLHQELIGASSAPSHTFAA